MTAMSVSKRWCFTLNNPGDKVPDKDGCRYLVYGQEIGESGTPHLQGFVVFSTNKRLAGCLKWLPGAHFEKARGTNLEASSYCKKDGNFVEEGTLPADTATAKSDLWKAVIASARAGTLEDTHPSVYVQNNRWYHQERSAYRKLESLDGTCGFWIYGLSGVGKTSAVFNTFGIDNVYDKGVNKWWDGYGDEETVLIDDVTVENGKYIASFLLRWADKFPVRVETKGGMLRVRPKRIICTSNYKLEDVFENCGVDMDAMRRRFRCIEKTTINSEIRFYILYFNDMVTKKVVDSVRAGVLNKSIVGGWPAVPTTPGTTFLCGYGILKPMAAFRVDSMGSMEYLLRLDAAFDCTISFSLTSTARNSPATMQ